MAKYKVEKLVTKKEIPIIFLNFFEDLVLAVVIFFFVFSSMTTKSHFKEMSEDYKSN